MSEKIRVLFLDRDGTINQDAGSYIAENHQLKIIPGAAEAMALAREAGFRIVVVTNQAGIARGIATVEQVEEVNRYLNELLSPHKACYDSCYYCPSHPLYPHPEYDQYKDCRKPATGMVDRAIADFLAEGYEVDRGASFLWVTRCLMWSVALPPRCIRYSSGLATTRRRYAGNTALCRNS